MAWLDVTSALGPLTCLTLWLTLIHALAIPVRPQDTGGRHPEHLKRLPGGTSRGGTSTSRDELRNRLNAFRRSILKEFGGVYNAGLRQGHPTSQSQPCSWQRPDDLQRMLPGGFLSEAELAHVVSQTNVGESSLQPTSTQGDRGVGLEGVTEGSIRQEAQGAQEAAFFNNKAGTAQHPRQNAGCQTCLTEIGYDILEHIVDFKGQNHTVINFKNAYQFIPSGRCLNEHSPCGQPGWRCRQVTRAQWTLVWTPGVGVNLVAHEVPSHCQCLNLGHSPQASLRLSTPTTDRQPSARGRGARGRGTGRDQHLQENTRDLGGGGGGGGGRMRGIGWAGLNMGQQGSVLNNGPCPFNSSSCKMSTSVFPTTSNPYPAVSNLFTGSSRSLPGSSDRFPGSWNPFPGSSDPYPPSPNPTNSGPFLEDADPYSGGSSRLLMLSQLSPAPSLLPDPNRQASPQSNAVWNGNSAPRLPSSFSSSSSSTAVADDDTTNAAFPVSLVSSPSKAPSTNVKDASPVTVT